MIIPPKDCSGCAACANVCATNAISMQQTSEGFYRPIVDKSICINCGACDRSCPWLNDVVNFNGSVSNPDAFAAYSLNEKARVVSSSGGLFSVFAEAILEKQGIVAGAAYSDPTHLHHILIEKKEDLKQLRGSKYFQSNAESIYKEIKKYLLDGRSVLFSGTPCQVAALYAVLGKRHFENLWTIDVVCHGVPSQKVFEKYINELENGYRVKIGRSSFRDKVTGWKNFSMTNDCVPELSKNESRTISNSLHTDLFMRAFLSNLCLNKSCANCHYAKIPRIADISLGDYWGVSLYHPEMDDDLGTSVVLLNSGHGRVLFEDAVDKKQVKVVPSKLEWAIAGNPRILHCCKLHKNRDAFMNAISSQSDLTLFDLLEKYNTKPNVIYRTFRVCWRLMNKCRNIVFKLPAKFSKRNKGIDKEKANDFR